MKLFAQLFRLLVQQLAYSLFSAPHGEPVPAPVRPRPHRHSGRVYDGEARRLPEPNRW